MEPNRETPRLCSLSDWSFRHIRNIFEAQSDEQALREIAATFSDAVDASLNGTPLTREGINRLVLTMRQASPRGLRVHWQQAVEVPQDSSTNRVSHTQSSQLATTYLPGARLLSQDGSFGGVYIIRGIHKLLPGTTKPVEFERHKTVTVK